MKAFLHILAGPGVILLLLTLLSCANVTWPGEEEPREEQKKEDPKEESKMPDKIQITTDAGDVILYSGNQIVLFYGSNTWSYTRLGKIAFSTLDQLKSFLKAGEGNINVTLSL